MSIPVVVVRRPGTPANEPGTPVMAPGGSGHGSSPRHPRRGHRQGRHRAAVLLQQGLRLGASTPTTPAATACSVRRTSGITSGIGAAQDGGAGQVTFYVHSEDPGRHAQAGRGARRARDHAPDRGRAGDDRRPLRRSRGSRRRPHVGRLLAASWPLIAARRAVRTDRAARYAAPMRIELPGSLPRGPHRRRRLGQVDLRAAPLPTDRDPELRRLPGDDRRRRGRPVGDVGRLQPAAYRRPAAAGARPADRHRRHERRAARSAAADRARHVASTSRPWPSSSTCPPTSSSDGTPDGPRGPCRPTSSSATAASSGARSMSCRTRGSRPSGCLTASRPSTPSRWFDRRGGGYRQTG